jgi:hypothetical protein
MKKLIFTTVLMGGVLLFSCSKEEESSTSDPNVFCNEAGCAISEVNKQKCINFYNACMASNPDANDDECVAGALAICK